MVSVDATEGHWGRKGQRVVTAGRKSEWRISEDHDPKAVRLEAESIPPVATRLYAQRPPTYGGCEVPGQFSSFGANPSPPHRSRTLFQTSPWIVCVVRGTGHGLRNERDTWEAEIWESTQPPPLGLEVVGLCNESPIVSVAPPRRRRLGPMYGRSKCFPFLNPNFSQESFYFVLLESRLSTVYRERVDNHEQGHCCLALPPV